MGSWNTDGAKDVGRTGNGGGGGHKMSFRVCSTVDIHEVMYRDFPFEIKNFYIDVKIVWVVLLVEVLWVMD